MILKRVLLFLAISFGASNIFAQRSTEICFFTHVEEMPLFNGAKDLKESLGFMEEYMKSRVAADSTSQKGMVRLSFLVHPIGIPVDVEVLQSTNPELNEIAIKYVEEMTPWKAGKQHGKPVHVQEIVAVTFE